MKSRFKNLLVICLVLSMVLSFAAANVYAASDLDVSAGDGSVTSEEVTVPVDPNGIKGSITGNGQMEVLTEELVAGEPVSIAVTPDEGFVLESITVKCNDKEIDATKVSDTEFSFIMPDGDVTVDVVFKEEAQRTNNFEDVNESDYFFEPVEWAVEVGITKGIDETHFRPDSICTRAQTVTFLWRAAGCPEPESADNPFTDVKSGDYYYDAVLWAVENGVTKGTSENTFSPDTKCERAHVVTFMNRLAGETVTADNPFSDVKDDAYYYNAVMWAVEKGITKGTSDTTFSPEQGCSRGQIVTFIFRNENSDVE